MTILGEGKTFHIINCNWIWVYVIHRIYIFKPQFILHFIKRNRNSSYIWYIFCVRCVGGQVNRDFFVNIIRYTYTNQASRRTKLSLSRPDPAPCCASPALHRAPFSPWTSCCWLVDTKLGLGSFCRECFPL